MRLLFLLFFVAFFAQCKKTDSNLVDFGKEYFPTEVGFWQEYQVDDGEGGGTASSSVTDMSKA